MKTKKSLPDNGRLGNFVCVDKQRLAKELSDFRKGVKSKEDVGTTTGVLFEHLRKLNMGWK